MIKLTVYPASFGEPSASPFCVKSMCMLKTAGLPFEVDETGDPRKAPKGKLPVIEHDGHTIADSEQIRIHIEAASGIDFQEGLNLGQRAITQAFIRMVEEHLYFAIVADRWANDANWRHVKAAFFSDIPALLRPMITGHIRKQALAQLDGQGIGRHSDEDRFERVKRDVMSIRDLLGNMDYLLGDLPTLIDYSVVPMLRASIATPEPTPLSRLITEDAALKAYTDRFCEVVYP